MWQTVKEFMFCKHLHYIPKELFVLLPNDGVF